MQRLSGRRQAIQASRGEDIGGNNDDDDDGDWDDELNDATKVYFDAEFTSEPVVDAAPLLDGHAISNMFDGFTYQPDSTVDSNDALEGFTYQPASNQPQLTGWIPGGEVDDGRRFNGLFDQGIICPPADQTPGTSFFFVFRMFIFRF